MKNVLAVINNRGLKIQQLDDYTYFVRCVIQSISKITDRKDFVIGATKIFAKMEKDYVSPVADFGVKNALYVDNTPARKEICTIVKNVPSDTSAKDVGEISGSKIVIEEKDAGHWLKQEKCIVKIVLSMAFAKLKIAITGR